MEQERPDRVERRLSAIATGQLEMAQQTLAELNAIRPDFTVQWFHQMGYARSNNPQFRREYDDILDGLRKAGVREQ